MPGDGKSATLGKFTEDVRHTETKDSWKMSEQFMLLSSPPPVRKINLVSLFPHYSCIRLVTALRCESAGCFCSEHF